MAMSYCSPRSITGRDQNGLLLDLGIVPIFAEILNVVNKSSGEDFLDFVAFLTHPPTISRLYSYFSSFLKKFTKVVSDSFTSFYPCIPSVVNAMPRR